MVLSRSVAQLVWGDQSPIGRRLKWDIPETDAPWFTVVGVVGPARYRSPRSVSLDAYVPSHQSKWPLSHFVVSATGDPRALVPAIRREMAAVDPAVQPVEIATTGEMMSAATAPARFNARLIGLFAAIALVLSAVGIYGVLAYTTTLRGQEFGIRMALGATEADVRLVAVRAALAMASIGVAGGLLLGLGTSRLVESQLFEISALEPRIYTLSAVFLLAMALAASWLPALQASRILPSEARRGE